MAEKKLISELLGEDDIFKMAELNAILTDALDTLDSAFIILRDEICVFENTGFRRILGLDEKDTFKGKSGEDLFNTIFSLRKGAGINDKITREKIQTMVKKNIREKTSFSDEILLDNGHWIKSTSRPWRDNGRVLTFSDITKLKRAQLDAEQADRVKTEFLANMSHEIRTPMNGIMGMTQLLANCDLGPREQNFIKIIDRSGQALLTIINDILYFSKIEAGHVKLDEAPFLLRECLEDVMALLSTAASDTGVDLLLRIDPHIPKTYIGDVGRLRQIVTNLVGNALKFTHEGYVVISAHADVRGETARLSLEVSDTGIGIDPEKLSQIFEKFSQVDGSMTREYEGTGLGLAIAKNLAEIMNGDIQAESQVGKGSTFAVTVELGIAETIEETPNADYPEPRGNILIIDDITINHEILKAQLTSDICKCVSVNSAELGLTILEKAHEKNVGIDLIIVDYQMPEMTGEDFIQIAKSHENYKHIPIVLYTSVDNDGLKKRLNEMGTSGYLTKPGRYKDIKRTISKALSDAQSSEAQSVEIEDEADLLLSALYDDTEITQKDVKADIDILIAEDNEINQMLIQYIMEDLGVSYKIVSNGRLAFDKWKLLSPKIVLMDISMPEWNGYEATKAIRDLEAKENRPRTPIIAVTAHALKSDKEKCLAHDMDDYLAKPLDVGSLRDVLKKWANLKNLPQLLVA